MVDSIMVNLYDSNMRLKELAAITTPDHKTIQIHPWDRSSVQPIMKAILAANVGLTPVSQGPLIRCVVPEMSGERRQEMVKVAKNMAEEARIGVRTVRREFLEFFKKAKTSGAITGDELKKAEKEMQKIVDATF
jgi:ribosome recycling factor